MNNRERLYLSLDSIRMPISLREKILSKTAKKRSRDFSGVLRAAAITAATLFMFGGVFFILNYMFSNPGNVGPGGADASPGPGTAGFYTDYRPEIIFYPPRQTIGAERFTASSTSMFAANDVTSQYAPLESTGVRIYEDKHSNVYIQKDGGDYLCLPGIFPSGGSSKLTVSEDGSRLAYSSYRVVPDGLLEESVACVIRLDDMTGVIAVCDNPDYTLKIEDVSFYASYARADVWLVSLVNAGGAEMKLGTAETTDNGPWRWQWLDENGDPKPAELPMLTLPELKMNWDGLPYANGAEDWENGNPWTPDMRFDTLPVFELTERLERHPAFMPYSREWLMEKARERMGWTEEERDRAIYADSDGLVSIQNYDLYARFADSPAAPTLGRDTATRGRAEELLAGFVAEYAGKFGFTQPRSFARRFAFGPLGWDIEMIMFDGAGEPLDQILNYNFNKVQYMADMDSGEWADILYREYMLGIIGDYPVISADEARALLLRGQYINPSVHAPAGAGGGPRYTPFPGGEYIVRTELLYDETMGMINYHLRTGDPVIPYYQFIVEMPGEAPEDEITHPGGPYQGMKVYGYFFVPAVRSEYLTNFPDPDVMLPPEPPATSYTPDPSFSVPDVGDTYDLSFLIDIEWPEPRDYAPDFKLFPLTSSPGVYKTCVKGPVTFLDGRLEPVKLPFEPDDWMVVDGIGYALRQSDGAGDGWGYGLVLMLADGSIPRDEDGGYIHPYNFDPDGVYFQTFGGTVVTHGLYDQERQKTDLGLYDAAAGRYVVKPGEYDYFEPYGGGLYYAAEGDSWHLLDYTGEKLYSWRGDRHDYYLDLTYQIFYKVSDHDQVHGWVARWGDRYVVIIPSEPNQPMLIVDRAGTVLYRGSCGSYVIDGDTLYFDREKYENGEVHHAYYRLSKDLDTVAVSGFPIISDGPLFYDPDAQSYILRGKNGEVPLSVPSDTGSLWTAGGFAIVSKKVNPEGSRNDPCAIYNLEGELLLEGIYGCIYEAPGPNGGMFVYLSPDVCVLLYPDGSTHNVANAPPVELIYYGG